MKNAQHSVISRLVPLMFVFFTMGFVDMVGTATNYVKADFVLSDTMANFLPSMVFLWFFFLSVPTSLIMNRIGKKKTVMASLVVTIAAMALPLFAYTYPVMLVSFCFLGIGNTLMQVSLNPLMRCIVKGDKLASTLTFGQFVKAIASFIAPILASWLTVRFGNWMYIYPIFGAVTIVSACYLGFSKIEEEQAADKASGFMDCFRMLGDPAILLMFLGIVAHVGIDVGINTCAPKIIMERLGMPLSEAAVATSVYFFFRTLGCLTGSYILAKWQPHKFFGLSVAMMVASMICLFACNSLTGIYIAIALVGYGNSNIFPVIFSKAVLSRPDKDNEVSGLMIMGLIGGTVFPLLMGVASDAMKTQTGSVMVISVGVIYLIALTFRFFKAAAK